MTTESVLNPYLVGNFAPVLDEREDLDLEVTGAIPPDLEGQLLRNGPNPAGAPDPGGYHWFVGDGMLHAIDIAGGRARYRNRWVRTPNAATELGEPGPGGVAEVSVVSSVANTSVVHHAARTFALVETNLPTEVRADLSTVGAYDYAGKLAGSFTAHPKIDPDTGEMFFFGYGLLEPPFVQFHVVDPDGTLVRTVPIDVPRAAMMHSFSVTATKVVWLDLPVVFDLNEFGKRPMPFVWQPDAGARVGVMSRVGNGEDLVWIDIEPCYVFHEMNAYDDAQGRVVLDVARYPDMFLTDLYGVGSTSAPRLERWTIDAEAGRVGMDVIDEAAQEFPRVHPGFLGRDYRYGYSVESKHGQADISTLGLRKHDLAAGTIERHALTPGGSAGEGVFVPAPGGGGEDAGWVLSVVYDPARDASDVIVVDATSFASPPVATIHLRRRVPFGFHGIWIPA